MPLTKEPTKPELLAELERLRSEAERLRQEKADLETMLEMTTEHADVVSEELQQEKDDLETVLELTAEHSDAISEELEDRNQFIRETFGRYVSDEVVASLLDSPEGLRLGGQRRKVTILMSDLRGFTSLSERLTPEQVVSFLNRYLERMVKTILDHNGTIIEILGDGILVIFGAPIQRENDAESAVACALSMQLALTETNAMNPGEGLPEVEMGIGIHTGDVVVGNIGSQRRTKYGVVGGPVNLTGRIESYTVGGQVLISESTHEETAASVQIRNTMEVEPKGVNRPITIYEVIGMHGAYNLALSEQKESLRPLDIPIPIRYTLLEEKFANRTRFEGRFVKLSTQEAELHAETPMAPLSDLKIQLFSPNGDLISDELFAKVLSVSTIDPTQVVIRFTSIPDTIIPFFQRGAVSTLS